MPLKKGGFDQLFNVQALATAQTGRSQDGRTPQAMLPSWEDMTARLDTDDGKKLYRQRAATIEPVFAQLTARLGRMLHCRGDAVFIPALSHDHETGALQGPACTLTSVGWVTASAASRRKAAARSKVSPMV